MRHGRDGVEHLQHGTYGEDTLHYLGYLLVVGEEVWQLCPEDAEECQVEQTYHQACYKSLEKSSVIEQYLLRREGLTTLAEVRAASVILAPMRLAILVDAAMESGKGMLNVVDVHVTRID